MARGPQGAGWLSLLILILPATPLACGGSTTSKAGNGGSGDVGGGSGTAGTGGASGSSSGASGSGQGGSGGGQGGFGSGQGGSAGASGGSGAVAGSSSVTLDGAPIYTRVQRLTVTQWKNAVADILGLEEPGSLGANLLAPPIGLAEFTNNENLLHVRRQEALEFEVASEGAAALATQSAEALSRLYSETDAEGFVAAPGRRAFRRPLTAEEQSKHEGVFALGEELYGAGFAQGAALVIRAMLVSPHFLYRTELGAAGEPLSGYEAASKLSFWLLGTTPSDALLDSAATGELDSVEGLESVARQMLEQGGAVEVMRDFHAQAFVLSRFDAVAKPNVPEFDETVAAELAAASTLFFDSVFVSGEGLREILTSPRVFVGPALAPLYGMNPPAAIEERALGASRAGYFMQVPFLSLFSSNEDPGTIGRGIALNLQFLCNRLPPPDPALPPIPPPASGQTNRERIEELTAGCGGDCHQVYIDPLGFAFEAFDGLGRERELDNGRPVDTSGRYPFADGTRDFAGARELVEIMADTAQAHVCYSKKVTGYALQRDMVEADRPLLESLSEVSREESLEVSRELASSPAVVTAFTTSCARI